MTQPRIFLQAGEEKDGCLRISGQRAHYLARVLRLRPGDMLVAVTPDGLELQAVIESIAATSVTAKVVAESRVAREPAHNLTLALAVLKSRAMDWALQKATEVGVREIIPVLSSRVIVRADGEQWEAKRRRWQQIAIEAARQSRRTLVPNVTEPVSVDEIASRCGSNGRWLLLDPSPQAIYSLSAALDAENDVGIIVGPEGDFDAAEKALLRDAGALPVSLGPRILRAETTAVVACAIVLYLLGDMQ